jgi:hypothetical protein
VKGLKLSVYVSRQVREDLDMVKLRFPGASNPELVRIALAAFADQVAVELEASELQRIEQEAYGIVWH